MGFHSYKCSYTQKIVWARLEEEAFPSAKHICVFPALLPISLDSSSVSVYREYLSQRHSQFAPRGECLRVIQQPPRSLTTGTHHPLRRLGYSSRRSETSTGFLELTQAFLHYVFVVAGSFSVSSGPLVHVLHPAARARLSVLQHERCRGVWGFQHLALDPAQSAAPVIPLFSVGASSLLFGLTPVPRSSIIFCGLTNELLKRLLRSKTKWQEDEWGKEVVVSGYGWEFWVGRLKVDTPNVCARLTPNLTIDRHEWANENMLRTVFPLWPYE